MCILEYLSLGLGMLKGLWFWLCYDEWYAWCVMCWILSICGIIGGWNPPAYCELICWQTGCCGSRLGQGCEYVWQVSSRGRNAQFFGDDAGDDARDDVGNDASDDVDVRDLW